MTEFQLVRDEAGQRYYVNGKRVDVVTYSRVQDIDDEIEGLELERSLLLNICDPRFPRCIACGEMHDPAEHQGAEDALTAMELWLMLHALGEPLQDPPENGKVYRNYYITTTRDPAGESLVARGLMTFHSLHDNRYLYKCTTRGIIAATGGKYQEETA